ncbi:MAG: hypothetical protein ABW195_05670 [Ilumatobacteraceae bacterium]
MPAPDISVISAHTAHRRGAAPVPSSTANRFRTRNNRSAGIRHRRAREKTVCTAILNIAADVTVVKPPPLDRALPTGARGGARTLANFVVDTAAVPLTTADA